MAEPVRSFNVWKVSAQRTAETVDHVAAEAPLEVRLNGEPFAVIMRTPGSDADLVAGFLFTEGVIRNAADVSRIDADDKAAMVNVILGRARAEILPELLGQRRQVTLNSSCGMCGRRSLESLESDRPPLEASWRVPAERILNFPHALRAAQRVFNETGGLHAAGIFDLHGQLDMSAEDVGRHNAVDKLLGRMLMENRLPLTGSLLFVSGRSSFEIVQKAFLGGLALVAAVSAPSSLAIELALRSGVTLLGFVRDGGFNIYSHPERVEQPAHST